MDTETTELAPFRVGIVLVDGFALMSYASAMEPLRSANLVAGKTLYDIQHMPAFGARAISSSGAIVGASTFLGEQVDFDLVLVVADGDVQAMNLRRLQHWLRLLASRQVEVGGVSAGALILAQAGVMDGYRLTVNWDHAPSLRALSAAAILERALYVQDRGRLSCAGGTAAMDMMHALIARHHGADFARRVIAGLDNTDTRPAAQVLLSDISRRHAVTDLKVLKALQAMENHLDDPLTLTQLSDIVDVSARHLNRLFMQHLTVSTVDYYMQLRIQKGKGLLKTGLLSVADVAHATGFANGAHFSRQFTRKFGLSPSRYRAQLRQ